MNTSSINISFGMIILNGEPFTKYNLRSLYPFAYEIIIVEGASPDAGAIATPDGHSSDGTLESIRKFISEEDPQNKVKLITAEDEGYSNGFWPGEKDEQSRVYAKYATGNYLWQIDSDEFYRAEEVEKLINYLTTHSDITSVSFPMITFWGNPYTWVDSWYLRRGANQYHRLFRWGPSYTYATHRPPTVLDDQGRDTRKVNWLNRKKMLKLGIYLYHYSLLFPRQVYEKCKYYEDSNIIGRKDAVDWYEHDFTNLDHPFRLHNVYEYPGWIQQWTGKIPLQIEKLWQAVINHEINEPRKDMDGSLKLLSSWKYRFQSSSLQWLDYFDRCIHFLKNNTFRMLYFVYANTIKRLRKKE